MDYVCEQCGRPLKAKPVNSQTLYPSETKMKIIPCAYCLDESFDEGRADAEDDISAAHDEGYDAGFENGKMQAKKEEAKASPPSWLNLS